MSHLTGLIAAPHTPFHADGSLNVEAIERQASLLLQSGAQGAFVAGTTGEGLSLSMEERQELGRRWVDVASGTDLRIILHVGHNSLPEARCLAKQAGEIGADAIAALPPFYFKPKPIDELMSFFCASVASAAPDTPFYYYDIPGMTGVRLSMPELMERAKKEIPGFRGIKYSHLDMVQIQECLAACSGECDVLFGCDESLLAGLALGLTGAVGSTYNYAAPHYHRIIRAFEQGDLATARREQLRSVQLVRLMQEHGFLAASKAVMSLVGIDCGPVRAPLSNLSSESRLHLLQSVEALEILCEPLTASNAPLTVGK